MEMITYEEIRKIQRIEKDEKNLQPLEKETVEKIRNYIKSKKEMMEKNKGNESIFLKISFELKNALKIIQNIFDRRTKKIVDQAILDARIGTQFSDTSKMLEFEKDLYNKIFQILKDYKNRFEIIFNKIEKVEEKEKNLMIRILEHVPEFKWENGTFGPFQKEDVANLPIEVAEILINGKKAVKIGDENGENNTKSKE